MTTLPRPEWEAAQADYAARVAPWLAERAARVCRGVKHPVWDFLFEYYSFKPAQLARWTPGLGVTLADAAPTEFPWPRHFTAVAGGSKLDPAQLGRHRLEYLDWAVNYLEAVGSREPFFGCHGLHEWAMVYRAPEVRHGRVPLRLSRTETDAVVESATLSCLHFDAYRFFTPDAVPLNRVSLSRPAATEHDQPGCVHVNMDLYKFATKVAPYVASETVAAAFELAAAARALDMRASPYDLRGYGFEPVAVETKAGREEYRAAQRELTERGRPVRGAVSAAYRGLRDAVRAAAAAAG